jgi:hypothetical protein
MNYRYKYGKMIKLMDRTHIAGLTVIHMWASGSKAGRMGREHIPG